MRIRVVLALATLIVVGALALDMSGSAVRTAGSDHADPLTFTAAVAPGGTACQPLAGLPGDAARVQLTVGSYGKPLPPLALRFLDAQGRTAAEGFLPGGGHEGVVTVGVRHRRGAGEAVEGCLRVGRGPGPVALGGEGVPVSALSQRVDGQPQPGRISLVYLRSRSESWWQLLPTLAERFALGKAPFFGVWLLPLAALALLGAWAAAVRLLARELR